MVIERKLCPTCSRPLSEKAAPDVICDETLRTITRGDLTIQLTPCQFRITTALLGVYPRAIAHTRLEMIVSPDTQEGVRSLSVHMHALRRRLAPLGIRTKTVRGFGYALDIDASWIAILYDPAVDTFGPRGDIGSTQKG